MSEKDNDNIINDIDNWWNRNKHSIAPKLSITLGILGGVGSALVGLKLLIPASIVLGVVNIGIFFSGLSMDRLNQESIKKTSEVQSLKNEKQDIIRRFTVCQNNYNNSLQSTQDQNMRLNDIDNAISPTTNNSNDTIEPVCFEMMHKNNIRHSAINAFHFPDN
jgi:hypothetical protein